MAKKSLTNHHNLLGICVLLMLGFGNCGKGGKFDVDLTSYDTELKVIRTESEFFAARNSADLKALRLKDSVFFDVYLNGILQDITGALSISEELRDQAFLEFTHNRDMRDLYRTVDSTFRNFDELKPALNKAFSRFNYYFGDSLIPVIYTFVSPFRYNTVRFENNLGIGLDLYLGDRFTPYYSPGLDFPQYKINKFSRERLVPDAVKSWLFSVFPKPDANRGLLSEMMYEGKVLYAMDALLPDIHDSLKMGYLKGQIEWCRQNEAEIWDHLLAENLLYSTDELEYRGVFSEGPFSRGRNVPQESAPRMAVWTGWQIVRKYMDRNPETSLSALMKNRDYEGILRNSGYKP